MDGRRPTGSCWRCACKIICTPGSKWLPTIAIRRAERTISDISATSLSSELDSNHNGHRHAFVKVDKRFSSESRGLET